MKQVEGCSPDGERSDLSVAEGGLPLLGGEGDVAAVVVAEDDGLGGIVDRDGRATATGPAERDDARRSFGRRLVVRHSDPFQRTVMKQPQR